MTRFLSRFKGLRLVMRPMNPAKEDLGKSIQFAEGEYHTEDPDEIAFIRANRAYGLSIIEIAPRKAAK